MLPSVLLPVAVIAIFHHCAAKPLLLLANRQDVQLIDAAYSANFTIVQNGLKNAVALDFYFKDKSVFWTDVSLAKIKRTWIDRPKNSEDIIVSGLVSPDGLACDWVTRKLYWTDSKTNRIEVSNFDGSFRSVLFWEELDEPRAIALDPLTGWMFWTDWGKVPKIERAGMDGDRTIRSIIIDSNIHWPNGLTIDYADNKIYWADAKVKYIASCDYDGKNRREVVSGEQILSHPFALTLSERTLYWTDWQDRSIFSCDKITGSDIRPVMEKINSLMDIQAFSSSRQPLRPGRHPCTVNNGGCSHLCLISTKDPFYTCACPTGVRPFNNTDCAEGMEQLLLVARRRDLLKISLDMPDHTDVVLPLEEIKNGIAVDYDPVKMQVYWTDDKLNTIKRAYLDGTGEEEIQANLDQPDGIAIDWFARNLFWTDSGANRIEVSRLNGSSRLVLVSEDLDEPRAIVLDLVAGLMYWSDWGETPKIEVANLDGSSRKVLVNSSLGWPNGLAIDIAASPKKLYWGDAKYDKIEMANVDGTNRKILVGGRQKVPHLFGLSLLGDYIYYTDWRKRTIEMVNKHNGTDRKVIVDAMPDLMGLKAINTVNQSVSGTNPCVHFNGGCSHLCLYTSDNGVVCACPVELQLSSDGNTCIPAFLLFTSQKRIKRVSLDTSYHVTTLPIEEVKALAIAFHVADSKIFWIDGEKKHIVGAFLNGSALDAIVWYGLTDPQDVAVEWMARNIYWIDAGKKARIEVARLDGSSRRVIIWEDLHSPRALAVDSLNGFIYWTDWTTQRLERAALDGTMRKIIRTEIGQVHGLTIDYGEKRLYWTSLDKKVIASSDLNGQHMELVITDQVSEPAGITLYRNFLLWADRQNDTIELANKSSGTNRNTILTNIDGVEDILVFHSSRQPGSNNCRNNNGGCSHLCLAHPVNHSSGTTHHCACPTHFRLNRDNKTCSDPTNYLLFSQKNTISRLLINNASTDIDTPEVVILKSSNIKAFSYDPVQHFVYWIEGDHMVIKKAADNRVYTSTLVSNPNSEHRPFDIAVDPYSRVLYWTCAKKNTINITGLDGTPIGVIVEGDSVVPRYIALNPLAGHMYWTDMGNQPSIMRASMDGTGHLKLFASELDRPGPLAIDVEGNKLYWADSRLNRIECSDLSGSNRKNLFDQGVANPRGMAIFGNFLFWIDMQHRTISRADKITGENKYIVYKGLENPSNLEVVRYFVPKYIHPCAINKRNCSHICVVDGEMKARCSCPLGQVIQEDQKTCKVLFSCSSRQFGCNGGLPAWLIVVIALVVVFIAVILMIVSLVIRQCKIRKLKNVKHNQPENQMKLLI